MPHIFDNISNQLLPALSDAMRLAHRSDFCVGYFNLRGWRLVDSLVDLWKGGDDNCCRLLVGMHRTPPDILRSHLRVAGSEDEIDQSMAHALRRKMAQEFKDQLTIGIPTEEDEIGLRKLAEQIKAKKLIVKLFLLYPLHAKLYLLYRNDPINPKIGYLGSSNLTLPGLSKQGELNVDILDHDACNKLENWFNDRWNELFCLDISQELVEIINNSWARPDLIPPYHIYIKIAYHLSREARAGLTEFRIPNDFGNMLFDFQKAAVQIAAHHLNKRRGVIIGDVVGLGKTLMATALARIFEDDHGYETLIICPKNLVRMWEDYRLHYKLRAKVMSITKVIGELKNLRRFRLVLIDESHNLRNRGGKRYKAIADYLDRNESCVILLSATPYNKSYIDLSNQIRLFIDEHADIGIRPEKLLRKIGETEFLRKHQCPIRSLAAFEKSVYADDWRDLMRLYLVRRTRSFIKENYAKHDAEQNPKYLEFADGTRSYFPTRIPKTVKFRINERDPNDRYAQLYADDVLFAVNSLMLPRYGLGNYQMPSHLNPPTKEEAKILADLSRAGSRLKGFCRTNLFKRLESSGHAFLMSVERHILRNFVFLHAIEKGLPLPIGTKDVIPPDYWESDMDIEEFDLDDEQDDLNNPELTADNGILSNEEQLRQGAAKVYSYYIKKKQSSFKWLKPAFFSEDLASDLKKDSETLLNVLKSAGNWAPEYDEKLKSLLSLVKVKHPNDKILVFSQFADTVHYLTSQLKSHGIDSIEGVTGHSIDPTEIAYRFSPISNEMAGKSAIEKPLRVVIATDVLSEGQNLQDCFIIVNFDLPWAIIRLVQRAGRVDRIGQKSDKILCYSFLPADGVERIISLRLRMSQRLKENAEVVGTDETFFEDQDNAQSIRDLFTEKAGIFDGDDDSDVDLSSYAYQIWKNAIDKNPELEKTVQNLPNVVYSTRPYEPTADQPEGALVYVRTADDNDALAWVGIDERSVTESQFEILKIAECDPDTPAIQKHKKHHEIVALGVKRIVETERSVGGQLGRPSGARFRTYERLKAFVEDNKGTLFDNAELRKAVEDIYKYPLLQSATDTLNRQLKSGISDVSLAELVVSLRSDSRLCRITDETKLTEPQLICSLGLRKDKGKKP